MYRVAHGNKQAKKKKSLLTSGLGRVDTGGGARSVVHVVEVDVHGEGRGAVLRQTDRQTDTHTQREKKYIHISSQFASSKLCNLLWLSMSFFSLSFFSLSLSPQTAVLTPDPGSTLRKGPQNLLWMAAVAAPVGLQVPAKKKKKKRKRKKA